MPRKTKRKKIAALQRHNQTITRSSIQTTPINQPTSHVLSPEEVQLRQFFMIDLKKSLLVTGLIFGIEILLYILSINNYLSKVFRF